MVRGENCVSQARAKVGQLETCPTRISNRPRKSDGGRSASWLIVGTVRHWKLHFRCIDFYARRRECIARGSTMSGT
jgi:hypothetical protein